MKTTAIIGGVLLIALMCGEVIAQTTKIAAPFPIVTWHQWNQLSDSQRNIYTEAFLETLSFQFYSHLPDDIKAREQFAAFTRCFEKEPVGRWIPYDWEMFAKNLDEPVAEQLLGYVSTVCKPYFGHSGSSLQPVKLIDEASWEKMSREDKNLYFMSYIETGYAMNERANDTQMANAIASCVTDVGIAKITKSLDTVSYEWQYPLPWSISKAFGSACGK